MKVLVLGGDGFCGWPTALHLSARGWDVAIVDNLSRRAIDQELEVQSLTPIRPILDRIAAWKEISGREIGFVDLTVGKDFDGLVALIRDWAPDSVVHFAEQRAAPYSMKSARHKLYTVDNNLNATNHLLAAIVESGRDVHLAHLGTMGVYGYTTAGLRIPEGYLTVTVDTDFGPTQQEILFPPNPGSIYHMTKTQDALLFQFYAKNDGLRITDLHQGIVWGTQTEETRRDERLINRFDYDGDYGTVLNRFLMQAAVGHPLTVHGSGGQTRAFIHIQDTVRCVELALNNPPKAGDRVKILNQMTESRRVRDLAAMIAQMTGAEVHNVANPRQEADENELVVANDQFRDLGLKPITLAQGLMDEVTDVARRWADRVDMTKIPCVSAWNAKRELALAEGKAPVPPARAVRRRTPAGASALLSPSGAADGWAGRRPGWSARPAGRPRPPRASPTAARRWRRKGSTPWTRPPPRRWRGPSRIALPCWSPPRRTSTAVRACGRWSRVWAATSGPTGSAMSRPRPSMATATAAGPSRTTPCTRPRWKGPAGCGPNGPGWRSPRGWA
jgi:UDP-sulfoquinovose synthase